jgi:flagellar motor protein MotB
MRMRIKTPHTSTNTWMLSFIDLVTLMLTFFVLIFATQKPNNMAWQAAQKSLNTAFNGLGGTNNNTPYTAANETVVQKITDDNNAGLDIDYLSGLLNKAWVQDPALGKIPFDIIVQNGAVHLRLSTQTWQDAQGIGPRVNVLGPLLMRLNNAVQVVSQTAEPDKGLVQAYVITQGLQQAGYSRPIQTLSQLSPEQDFIDVVLTFDAP